MDEYTEYRRTGVTDIKEMDKLHDIRQEIINNGGMEETAKNQSLELAKLSTKYDKTIFRDGKKRKSAENALTHKFLGVKDKEGNSKLTAQQARMASRETGKNRKNKRKNKNTDPKALSFGPTFI